MIERLELRNFTVFKDLRIDFSPRINVIIGENGTGKTHLLKAAYGLCAGAPLFKTNPNATIRELEATLTKKLLRLFSPLGCKLGKMHHHGASEKTYLSAQFNQGQTVTATFHRSSRALAAEASTSFRSYQAEAVFIPTKEVLSLIKGMADTTLSPGAIDVLFDDGYLDLAQALLKTGHEDSDTLVNLDPRLSTIIPQLVNLIGGRYQFEREGFCFQAGKYVEKASPRRTKSIAAQVYQDSTVTEFVADKGRIFSSSITAEGFRKVGILHRLLCNKTITPGLSGPLIWDEPEANMNPRLMKMLVQIMLELSRNGQQIILATHDYVLLKWFDLLAKSGKEDHIRFHALAHQETGIAIQSADNYKDLDHNAITRTFSDLYDEEIKRSIGGC